MPRARMTHDYTLECSNLTGRRGFMYTRDENGLRQFVINSTQPIAPRTLTRGQLEQSEFPPEFELTAFQQDWRGGIGGVQAKETVVSESAFLATGVRIDTSGDGRIRLAQELRITTLACGVATPTATRPAGFAAIGTEVWVNMGRDMYEWSFANCKLTNKKTPLSANVVYRNGVNYKTRAIMPSWDVCGHTPNRYIYKADADSCWSIIGTGSGTQLIGAKFLATAQNASNAEILWGAYIKRADSSYGTNIIASTTDVTSNSAWSSEVKIGECDSPITNLLVGDCNRILVFKTNGIYTYETGGTVKNLTPGLENNPHPDNFKAATYWQGRIIASTGTQGMIELTPSSCGKYTERCIAPTRIFPRQSKYHSRMIALHGDDRYLYALNHDATNDKHYLLKAELVCVEGQSDYRWHPLSDIRYSTGTCEEETALFTEGLTASCKIHDRLWDGMYNSGSATMPYYYPTSSYDTSFGFTNCVDAEAQTVEISFGLPRVCKRFERVQLETENLGSNCREVGIQYRIDGGSWTNMGTFSTSPTETHNFAPGKTGKILELKIKPSQSGIATTSPEVVSARITAQLRPDPLYSLPMTAYLADNTTLLNGTRGGRPKSDIIQLRAWNEGAAEVILRTPDGIQPRYAVFLPGTLEEREVRFTSSVRPEKVVSFTLGDVRNFDDTPTWNLITWNQFTWA